MRLSTRGRYAARAMLDLALHDSKGPVSLREISEREGISVKYLDQILSLLRRAGYIRSNRGARGGFKLAVDPSTITLLDVVTAVEGRTALVDCVLAPNRCERAAKCVTRQLWQQVTEAMEKTLRAITLADLVKKVRSSEQEGG